MKQEINVKCNKGNLALIRNFVQGWLDKQEIAGVTANQIVLAVDEACANCIIHHHKCDGRSNIKVRLHNEAGTVHVEIQDTGKAFPIDQYQPQAINDIIRKRNKGGMGIYLINQIMDEIEIEQKKDYFVYKFAKRVD